MNVTQSAVEVAEDIEAVQTGVVIVSVLTANTILLAYEYLLNFASEVKHIWMKKMSVSSFLYCLARYSSLATFLWSISINYLETFDAINPAFGALGASAIFPTLVNVLSYCGIQGLLATRLYAISGENKSLFIVAFVVLLCDFALTVSANVLDVNPNGQGFLLQKITNLLILFDTLVFFATLYKTIGIWKLERELDASRGIAVVLLEQGILRYCFVMTITVASTTLTLTNMSTFSTFLTPFQNSLSAIILCRITLQLRQRYERQIDAVNLPTLAFSFRSFKDTVNYIDRSLMAEAGFEMESTPTSSPVTSNDHDEWLNEEDSESRSYTESEV